MFFSFFSPHYWLISQGREKAGKKFWVVSAVCFIMLVSSTNILKQAPLKSGRKSISMELKMISSLQPAIKNESFISTKLSSKSELSGSNTKRIKIITTEISLCLLTGRKYYCLSLDVKNKHYLLCTSLPPSIPLELESSFGMF